MKHLTSSQNPAYKHIKQLSLNQRARNKAGLTVLEGIHLCQSYLQHGGVPEMCVVTEDAQNHPEVERLIAECTKLGVECTMVTNSMFASMSIVEHGIGIAMVIKPPSLSTPALLNNSAVLLDDVQDPGNVGTILRTAAAAGIKEIYCSTGTAAVWSPKVLRAGMGSHFSLSIFTEVLLEEIVQSSHLPILATSSYATKSIYEIDLSQPAAWIMGNEGQGVSQRLIELKNVQQVIIPQEPEVESLNVAAAAAVCLFEQRRQMVTGDG